MNNEFNNQNMNQFENNNMNNDYSNNYNDLNNQNNKKGSNGLTNALILIIIALAGVCLYLVLNKEDTDIHNKLNYEIRSEIDSSTGAKWFYLYLNDKKVNNIKAYEELGKLEVKEFKDLLIVDEMNPGPSRRLLVVDKNGNATEIDYKVSTYNAEFINSIDSYRVEGNNLYIKVNRQWGNGYIDWYCRYEDNNEVAEYEVKYEYVNGKLENKQVLNEITIANKYQNEKCNTNNESFTGALTR